MRSCLTHIARRMSSTSPSSSASLFSGLRGVDRRGTLEVGVERGGSGGEGGGQVLRTSPTYLPTILGLPNTQFHILHKLRPLVASCDRGGTHSLVAVSPAALQSALPSVFASTSSSSTTSSTSSTSSNLAFAEGVNPVVLGTRADGQVVAFLDVSESAPDADAVLASLKPALPSSSTSAPAGAEACSDESTVTYSFPDARELLFGPSLMGTMRFREGKERKSSALAARIAAEGSVPSSPSTSSSSSSSSAATSLLPDDVQPADLEWPLPFEDIAAYGAARAIFTWHSRTKFCGSCGRPTRVAGGGMRRVCTGALTEENNGKEGGKEVPKCKDTSYPRTDPVVITLVQTSDGSRCLLGRQPGFPKGFYSCLAGFVEAGESLEEAAAREVFEESGIVVRDPKYVASQPWPLGRGMFGQLMIGFVGTAADDQVENVVAGAVGEVEGGSLAALPPRITMDATELEDARWFTREEVSAALDAAWRKNKKEKVEGRRRSREGVDSSPSSTSSAAASDTTAANPSSPTASEVVAPTRRLILPGPFAIAHQLLRAWARGEIGARAGVDRGNGGAGRAAGEAVAAARL